MKMLIIGGGLQGGAAAWSLLKNPAVTQVTLADVHPERLPVFLVNAGPRFRTAGLMTGGSGPRKLLLDIEAQAPKFKR